MPKATVYLRGFRCPVTVTDRVSVTHGHLEAVATSGAKTRSSLVRTPRVTAYAARAGRRGPPGRRGSGQPRLSSARSGRASPRRGSSSPGSGSPLTARSTHVWTDTVFRFPLATRSWSMYFGPWPTGRLEGRCLRIRPLGVSVRPPLVDTTCGQPGSGYQVSPATGTKSSATAILPTVRDCYDLAKWYSLTWRFRRWAVS